MGCSSSYPPRGGCVRLLSESRSMRYNSLPANRRIVASAPTTDGVIQKETTMSQMNTADTIDFIYSDVFEYYKQNEDYPNLLILNYVISDVVRRYPIEKRNSFLQSLVELIENMPKGSFVLVNDINLGNNEKGARYYHSIICQKLQAKGIQIKDIKLHFKSSLPYYFHYGNEMPNNHIVGNIPNDIEAKYDPWDECRSAALIFRKDS